jgi:hypothetical protein
MMASAIAAQVICTGHPSGTVSSTMRVMNRRPSDQVKRQLRDTAVTLFTDEFMIHLPGGPYPYPAPAVMAFLTGCEPAAAHHLDRRLADVG